MSDNEGIRGKPILVIAVEDENRDYYDVYQAVLKTLDENGRHVIGSYRYFGIQMLTVRKGDEKK